VAHCFTACTTASLVGKCCPRSPSFIGPNKWESEGAKSGLYSGCGKTVHPRLAMCSTVFKLVWGLALSCCKRKVVFFSGLSLDIQSRTRFHSCNPPIRADELIEMLFISWCNSCAWPSGTWLVFHVAVTSAETRHPLPHCANIHCLVSVKV